MNLNSSRFLLLTVLLTLISASSFISTVCSSLPVPLINAPLGFSRSLKQRRLTSSSNLYTTHYFLQELDHFTFRPDSFNLFYQRYLMNSTYWDNGTNKSGPIFVYTGHEGDAVSTAEMMGFLYEIAPKFGALLVFIEHRYYGVSMPFGNNSYASAETLGYLTSTQALADYAILLTSLKQNLSAEASPVVVFGGSYGGMLAAWFRLKYPHLSIGALASSAPILQFDNLTPWSSFYDVVSQDFKDESINCFEVIKESWDEIFAKGSTPAGLEELSKTFKTCQTVQSVYSFRNWLWSSYVSAAQGGFAAEMCRRIDGFPKGSDKIDMVIAAANVYYNNSGDQTCFQISPEPKASEPQNNRTSESPGIGSDGWGWQACTEMIMPMTTTNQSMFPPHDFTYEEKTMSCKSAYGVNPRPQWITTEYGGLRIEKVLKRFGSNIIFSNGMKDPWSRGGVLKNISSSIIALVTQNGSHVQDLLFPIADNPVWLTQQRNQEIAIIQGWLDEYYQDF